MKTSSKPKTKSRAGALKTPKTKKPIARDSTPQRKLLAIVGGIIAVLLVALFIFVLVIPDDEAMLDIDPNERSVSAESRRPVVEQADDLTSTSIPSRQLAQDPELLELLRIIGAQYLQNLEFSFVDGYSGEGDTDGEYEEFYYDDEDEGFDYGVMTVKRGLDAEEQRRTVAHEYLHHVWYAKLTPALKDTLTGHLNGMLATDEYMQEYEEHYRDSGGLIPTELFSFYCTEVSDAKLVQYVLDQCNRFIDRSQLVMLN